MYINLTILKVKPENVQTLTEILVNEKMHAFYRAISGFQRGYVTESVEEPGKILNISHWDSAVDAQRTMSDPAYAGLIGDMRKYLIAPPERYGYTLLREFLEEDLQFK